MKNKGNMSLKDYREQPDAGLYEKIERRLRMRRWARVGVVAAVTIVAAAAIVLGMAPSKEEGDRTVTRIVDMPEVAMAEPQSAVSQREIAKENIVTKETPHAVSLQTERNLPVPVSQETPLAEALQTEKVVTVATYQEKPKVVPSQAAPVVADNAVDATKQPAVSLYNTSADSHPEDTPQADNTPAVKAGNNTGSAEEHGLIMWAPNAIAPDGEEEANRHFRLKFNASVKEFHVYIYNRNGRQLYTSMDPAFEWDATYNGTKMPQGAYVWVAKFRDSDNKVHQEKGTVTVIR